MMVMLLLLICWPIAEVLVALRVADMIGALPTLLALAAGLPLGIWLLRAEGRSAGRRLQAAVAAGRPPAGEVIDGALVVAAGVLLIVPGFITDVLALVLFLPVTRGLTRRWISGKLRGHLLSRAAAAGARPSYDVDSTATEGQRTQLHG
jgi:UPF0716 protein FxsA